MQSPNQIETKITDGKGKEDYNKFKKGTSNKLISLTRKITNAESNIAIMLEKTNINYANIYQKIEKIEKSISLLTDVNKEILEKLNSKSNSPSNLKVDVQQKRCDLIVKSVNIDPKVILKCLSLTSLCGDINLFKLLYLDNKEQDHVSIRSRSKKKEFEYWLDNDWHDDFNGLYIKNTILKKNITRYYLKVNQISNIIDTDQFIKNQKHITRLSESKYQDMWLSEIRKLIPEKL